MVGGGSRLSHDWEITSLRTKLDPHATKDQGIRGSCLFQNIWYVAVCSACPVCRRPACSSSRQPLSYIQIRRGECRVASSSYTSRQNLIFVDLTDDLNRGTVRLEITSASKRGSDLICPMCFILYAVALVYRPSPSCPSSWRGPRRDRLVRQQTAKACGHARSPRARD